MAAVLFLCAAATLTAGHVFAGRVIFSGPEAILRGPIGARALAVGDADNDGDLDVFVGFRAAENLNDTVAWLENDGHPGRPSFAYHVVEFGLSEPVMSILPTDIDADGDLDFSMGTSSFLGGSHDWFENDGLSPPGFTIRNLEPEGLRTLSIDAADLDMDGDIDLVSAHSFFDRITWHENDPLSPERFSPHIVTDDPDGPFFPMTGFAHGVVDVIFADLDSDDDLDLISANRANHTVAWFSNNGGLPPVFEPRLIDTFALFARDLVAVDVDADGDLDVIACSEADDKIAWHENDGAPVPGFKEHVIVEDPDGHSGPLNGFADNPISIFAVDLDRDGDIDLISSSDGNSLIAWYENDGASVPSFRPRIITTEIHRPGQVVAADLDGDGDQDVLTVSQTFSAPETARVVWIEQRATLPHSKGGKHWKKPRDQ